jgi:hypothetical protein
VCHQTVRSLHGWFLLCTDVSSGSRSGAHEARLRRRAGGWLAAAAGVRRGHSQLQACRVSVGQWRDCVHYPKDIGVDDARAGRSPWSPASWSTRASPWLTPMRQAVDSQGMATPRSACSSERRTPWRAYLADRLTPRQNRPRRHDLDALPLHLLVARLAGLLSRDHRRMSVGVRCFEHGQHASGGWVWQKPSQGGSADWILSPA